MSKKLLFVIPLFALFILQSFSVTSPKSGLKNRVKAFLDLSVNLSGDQAKDVERIKSFLEPSEQRDQLAQDIYINWRQELEAYGQQRKRITGIRFINKKSMAFVEVTVVRDVPRKGAKKPDTMDQMIYLLKSTWVLVDDEWMSRTKKLSD